jgi:hypothetical protein
MRRLGLLALALAIVVAGCGGGGTLSESALEKNAEAIESLAAEGSLLAEEAAEGSTTTAFARVHAEYLAEAADKLSRTLESARPNESVRKKRTEALRLSREVSRDLGELGSSPSDRPLARRLKARLDHAAEAAGQLAE